MIALRRVAGLRLSLALRVARVALVALAGTAYPRRARVSSSHAARAARDLVGRTLIPVGQASEC